MITPGMIGMHMLPRCPILSSQLKQSQVDFDSDPTRDRTCTRFWEFQRMQMRPLSRRLELGSSARCCETDHSWPGLQEVVHSATCLKEIYIVTYCNCGSSPSKTWKYTYSTVQSGWSLMKAPREYGMVLLASCQSQSCAVWMEPGSASSTQVSPRQESRWSVKGKVCGNQKLGIVACHIYNNYNI